MGGLRLFMRPGCQAADDDSHHQQAGEGEQILGVGHDEGIVGWDKTKVEGGHAQHTDQHGCFPAEIKRCDDHRDQVQHDQVRRLD